jgi:hypothetical protein
MTVPPSRGRIARWGAALLAAPALAAACPAVAAAGPAPADRVIVVGMAGLQWDDLDATRTPALWALAGDGAVAALSVRTVRPRACPLDGWLTLGAGRRATAERPGPGGGTACPRIPDPVSGRADLVLPGWPAMAAYNDGFGYQPRFGLLHSSVAGAGGCVTGVGAGAAAALAGADGRLPVEAARPATTPLDRALLDRCPLTVVDLGDVPEDAAETAAAPVVAPEADPAGPRPDEAGVGPAVRRRVVEAADRRLGRIVAARPDRSTLVVLGLADSGWRPHLHVAIAHGPGRATAYGRGWLTAASTRRDGMVQLTDATPTVLAAIGVEPAGDVVGAVWQVAAAGPAAPAARAARAVPRLEEEDGKAQVIRDASPWFFNVVSVLQISLYLLVAVLVGASRRAVRHLPRETALTNALHRGCLFLGAVPVATFLANLAPWWRAGRPLVALTAAVGVIAAGLGVLAVIGPWRRRAFGPSTFLAACTAGVLAADVASGSALQMSSLLGHSPLIAGRFYGFGNVAFAVFGTAAVLAAAGLVEPYVRSGRRRAAGALVGALGAAAVVVNGWPAFGSDFGGVLALVPGFALLGLRVAGVRLTVARAALVGVGAVVAVGAIAVLDWLRPPSARSHLGDFVQTVLDGGVADVLGRKLETNLNSLTSGPLAFVVPILFVALAVLVLSPDRLHARALAAAYRRAPTLSAGLVAALVVGVVGFAVNDSGVVIPAVALTVGGPLAVAACAAPSGTGEGARSARAARGRRAARASARV